MDHRETKRAQRIGISARTVTRNHRGLPEIVFKMFAIREEYKEHMYAQNLQRYMIQIIGGKTPKQKQISLKDFSIAGSL